MKQKKVIRALMVFLFSIIMIVTCKMTIYATNVNGSITSGNAVVGENITLTVSLSSEGEIFGFDVYVQYDASKLEFVSGASDIASVNGGNGRIQLYCDTCSSNNITATLTFKAKEAGNHNVYLTADSTIYDSEVNEMQLVATTGVITATTEAPVSNDNNLKDLTIYIQDENGKTTNGWYWPAFNKDTTQYYLNVDSTAKKLAITANANHAAGTVSLNNPDLVTGNNTITITVKAQDGSTKNYVIAVTKAEKATQPESESESQVNEESTTSGESNTEQKVNIGGNTYNITNYNDEMTLPEGYEIIDYEYKGNNVKALKGLGTGLILMAFLDSDSKIQSFVYDAVADEFYKFTTANVKSAQYVLVDMPSTIDGVNIPTNYKLSSINYNDTVLVAYVADASKIYIVYAIDCNGKKGLYYLDSEDNTLIRYFEGEKIIQTDNGNNNENANGGANDNSDEVYKLKIQSRIILIASVTIILVLLGIILALLVSRSNEEDDDDDDEYDDEEEFDGDEEEYASDEEEYDSHENEYASDENYDYEENNEDEENDDEYEKYEESDNYVEDTPIHVVSETEEAIQETSEMEETKVEETAMPEEAAIAKKSVVPEEAAIPKESVVPEEAAIPKETVITEELTTKDKVNELLKDDSTSLNADELDMVLDELLNDIFDGDK